MALVSRKIVILVFLCSCLPCDWCYPTGAPTSACVTMLPGHRDAGQPIPEQDRASSPFVITSNHMDYTPNQIITVTIDAAASSGSVMFQGFLMQARMVGTDTPVGTFLAPSDNGAHVLTCTNANDSITHSDPTTKTTSYFIEWKAPSTNVGDIEFVATVAYSKQIFWRQLKSEVISEFSGLCEPNPCYNGGTCYQSADGRSYFCGCPDSTNQNTNCEVPCTPNPCLNGGFCMERNGSFVCYCPGDRYGTLCENQIIGCDTNPCQNGGICTDHSTGHICECTTGYIGPDCETMSPCTVNPCENGGTCNIVGITTEYSCSCVDGFSGNQCQTVSNPCVLSVCQNGGTCFRNQAGRTICICPSTHTGANCETIIHPCMLPTPPCMNGGICFSSGGGGLGYICQCQVGYSGDNCENSVGPCEVNPCVNGGTCQEGTGTSYTCSCPSQYEGVNCENQVPCFGVTCSNRGTCQPSADPMGYTCLCQTSYDGDSCQYTNFCELNNQCGEGSTCIYNGEGDFTCNCRAGFGGAYCEMDLSCLGSNPCLNGGTCLQVGDGTHTCECVPTYSGNDCGNYTNPCVPNPCANGNCRIVLQLPTGRECTCDANYMGELCTIYNGNPCEVFSCINGGTCINNNQQAVCVCPTDYSGLNCEIALNVPPAFNGCPSLIMPQYPMNEGSNAAYIDLTITARDRDSMPLTVVTLEDPTITFPSTIIFTEEYRNGKMFTLEATDKDGRSSLCVFTLRIIDNEDPKVSCPADISDITTETSKAVQWLPATATDNLGLSSENPWEYTPSNGTKFQAAPDGHRSTVIVKARDRFDNIGQCQFTVTVYKKEKDCTAFSTPSNSRSSCTVDGDERQCTVECNEGFGNAVGDNLYECVYGARSANWNPRPNSNICVPLKPGSGVSKVVTVRFPVNSERCSSVDFTNSVTSSLTVSLTNLGVCDSSKMSCELSMKCGDSSGARRRRATTDLTVDITITGMTSDGDVTTDVQGRLDTAVDTVTSAATSGTLTIEGDGVVINNDDMAIGVSDYTWDCNSGQISSPDGCLSCPPGTFHNAMTNRCEYCMLNTYQNKPEQDSCISCPESTTGNQQIGAYREDQCGEKQEEIVSPWTPTLIAIVAAAGGLIVLLVVVLCCVFIVKSSSSPSKRDSSSKRDPDGPLSNFTHLNHAYKEDDEDQEMQFHGGISATSDTTYQNVDDDVLETRSTDHLVRIPSLSQYSDYYATLNTRSAPVIEDDEVPSTPPPPPPVFAPKPPSAVPSSPPAAPPAPPAPGMNTNNSNTIITHKSNGSVMNGGSKAKFQV